MLTFRTRVSIPVICLLTIMALSIATAGAFADGGGLLLASSTAAGAAGSSGSDQPSIGSDGRYVAFRSDAPNLPGSNGREQIYRKDLSNGAIVLASSTGAGAAGNLASGEPDISHCGRYVAFHSDAANFPGANGQDQVYRKDLTTGALTLASSTGGGATGDSYSNHASMSADGRYVAFFSDSSNFPGANGWEQSYRKDLNTGALLLASSNTGGSVGDSVSGHTSISPDGRYVAFFSDSSNFPGANGQDQVYRKDMSSGTLLLVSSTAAGQAGGAGSYNPWMSTDGRHVVFGSNAANFPKSNGNDQVYIKNMANGVLSLASSDSAGTAGSSNSYAFGRAVTSDGGYAVFNSDSPNFPESDGNDQVYRKDISSGRLEIVSSTSACEPSDTGSGPGAISPEGRCVAFVSRSTNLPGANGQDQVYRKELGIPSPDWYLAEGTTAWGFSTYVSIQNLNSSDTSAEVTYMTDEGPVELGTVDLPAGSQTTINPRDKLGDRDFSTRVTCTENKSIAVDRTMTWTGGAGAAGRGAGEEAHCSVGVTSPAGTWYLAEGSSAWGFECWLLVQNPNADEATCTVTYMIEGADPQVFEKTVPGNSRKTFNMAADIGERDASIKVDSDRPVIPERAMYRNGRREGHDSIGTTAPANEFYLAEGATGYNVGYITYVLVQNPQDSPTDVALTYQTGAGQIAGPEYRMPANSRKTFRLNDQLSPNTDVSTRVNGSRPIIAERAMYWDNGTGEACHDSIGMDAPHESFYLPDGQTSDGRETWTLVQNTNAEDVSVDITYMTPSGEGNVTRTETIPANSRRTFNMLEHSGITGRAAIAVTCTTACRKVMVERAMYWNSRGAGTDTIGGSMD